MWCFKWSWLLLKHGSHLDYSRCFMDLILTIPGCFMDHILAIPGCCFFIYGFQWTTMYHLVFSFKPRATMHFITPVTHTASTPIFFCGRHALPCIDDCNQLWYFVKVNTFLRRSILIFFFHHIHSRSCFKKFVCALACMHASVFVSGAEHNPFKQYVVFYASEVHLTGARTIYMAIY